jgi:hypothetical protein
MRGRHGVKKWGHVLLLIAVFLVVVAGGCGRTTSGEAVSALATSASAATQSLAPGACTPAEARQAFAEFVSAYNRGDLRRLDSLFARQPAFAWYSSNAPGARLNRAAARRDTLIAYFSDRHLDRDRLRPVEISVITAAPHQTGLSLELRRRAADYRGGRWLSVAGKAALACHDGRARFLVVSLGTPRSSA